MSQTDQYIVSRIKTLISKIGYTSSFENNVLKFNDQVYKLPPVNSKTSQNNNRVR